MLINYVQVFETTTKKRLPASVYDRVERKALPRKTNRRRLEKKRPVTAITVYASTHCGTKEANEDSFCVYNVAQSILSSQSESESYEARFDFSKTDGLLMAVADGISSVPKARESSAAVIEQLITSYPTLSLENGKFITRAIEGINRNISRKDPGELGSTLAMVFLCQNQVQCANIGDSAIYHIHNGTMRRISVDDTAAQEMIDEGYEPQQINESFFHSLTQYIGQSRTVMPHMTAFEVEPGDILIIMSDAFEPDMNTVLNLIQQDGNPAEKLIFDFKENRSEYYMDNSTVIIAVMS